MLAGMKIGVKRCEKRRRALFGLKNVKVALFMTGKMKTNTVVNMVEGLHVVERFLEVSPASAALRTPSKQ